jgi:hypothetical protein
LVQRKIILCRCAYYKGNPVQFFFFFHGIAASGLVIFFEKYFVFSTPPDPFEGFYWNIVQRKITLCRCTYCKGSLV